MSRISQREPGKTLRADGTPPRKGVNPPLSDDLAPLEPILLLIGRHCKKVQVSVPVTFRRLHTVTELSEALY
jgi:hypothetical protein